MNIKEAQGVLIIRRWDPNQGLIERRIDFNSIHDLLKHTFSLDKTETPDRIEMRGLDGSGKRKRMTLDFHSITEDINENKVSMEPCVSY